MCWALKRYSDIKSDYNWKGHRTFLKSDGKTIFNILVSLACGTFCVILLSMASYKEADRKTFNVMEHIPLMSSTALVSAVIVMTPNTGTACKVNLPRMYDMDTLRELYPKHQNFTGYVTLDFFKNEYYVDGRCYLDAVTPFVINPLTAGFTWGAIVLFMCCLYAGVELYGINVYLPKVNDADEKERKTKNIETITRVV